MEPALPTAEAVAVRGGRIAYVGSQAGARERAGSETRVIDVEGGSVLRGFQDAHVHPSHGGLARMRCDLHDAAGPDEYVARIEAYARAKPDRPWILGAGWSMDDFPGGTPTASILDPALPDRLAYLPNRDGHGAWVNSVALRMAGLTRETPDPVDGRIERDQSGHPQGTLHEGAMHLVERLIPPTTQKELMESLRIGQSYLHSLGITAWQDAIVGPPELDAYVALVTSGELTARVVAALWWDRARGEEQIEGLTELRARGVVGRLRATSVKIMQDGVLENYTAGVLAPYLDATGRATANRGKSFVEPELLKRAVSRLDREGFQVHIHAIGERAVREALDAFQAARTANGPNDHRHHIAHIQLVHPDDIPRFGELGVTANGQPYWACLDGQMVDLTIPFIGPERTAWQYPFASLVRSGARLAFGSDWPVSTPNPLAEIQVAATRVGGGDEHDVLVPGERLEVLDAVAAFTSGSAYVNHLDDQTGTIREGMLADLVVLDRDLFALEPFSLAEASVRLTMVEGERVFAADGWSW